MQGGENEKKGEEKGEEKTERNVYVCTIKPIADRPDRIKDSTLVVFLIPKL